MNVLTKFLVFLVFFRDINIELNLKASYPERVSLLQVVKQSGLELATGNDNSGRLEALKDRLLQILPESSVKSDLPSRPTCISDDNIQVERCTTYEEDNNMDRSNSEATPRTSRRIQVQKESGDYVSIVQSLLGKKSAKYSKSAETVKDDDVVNNQPNTEEVSNESEASNVSVTEKNPRKRGRPRKGTLDAPKVLPKKITPGKRGRPRKSSIVLPSNENNESNDGSEMVDNVDGKETSADSYAGSSPKRIKLHEDLDVSIVSVSSPRRSGRKVKRSFKLQQADILDEAALDKEIVGQVTVKVEDPFNDEITEGIDDDTGNMDDTDANESRMERLDGYSETEMDESSMYEREENSDFDSDIEEWANKTHNDSHDQTTEKPTRPRGFKQINGWFICQICMESERHIFTSIPDLTQHLKYEHAVFDDSGSSTLTCPLCEEVFVAGELYNFIEIRQFLFEHMAQNHNRNFRFGKNTGDNVADIKEQQKAMYKCLVCTGEDKLFGSMRWLRNHIAVDHIVTDDENEDYTIKCQVCPKQFRSQVKGGQTQCRQMIFRFLKHVEEKHSIICQVNSSQLLYEMGSAAREVEDETNVTDVYDDYTDEESTQDEATGEKEEVDQSKPYSYVCKLCDNSENKEAFNTKQLLIEHIIDNHSSVEDQQYLTCPECTWIADKSTLPQLKPSWFASRLIDHMIFSHNAQFTTATVLKVSDKPEETDQNVKCPEKSEGATDSIGEEEVESEMEMTCFMCVESPIFKEEQDLFKHLSSKHQLISDVDGENVSHSCSLCQTTFKYSSHIMKVFVMHLVRKHGLALPRWMKVYKCKKCCFETLLLEQYGVHQISRHTDIFQKKQIGTQDRKVRKVRKLNFIFMYYYILCIIIFCFYHLFLYLFYISGTLCKQVCKAYKVTLIENKVYKQTI